MTGPPAVGQPEAAETVGGAIPRSMAAAAAACDWMDAGFEANAKLGGLKAGCIIARLGAAAKMEAGVMVVAVTGPAGPEPSLLGSADLTAAADAAAIAAAAVMLSPLAARISISRICSWRISSLESGMRYFLTSVRA